VSVFTAYTWSIFSLQQAAVDVGTISSEKSNRKKDKRTQQ
jgi:hypothetical protein